MSMSRIAISAGALVLALAACSGGEKAADKAKAGGGEKVAVAPGAAPMKLRPGEYETSAKVLEFSMAGVPQSQIDMMKGAMSGNMEKPYRYCLTEAQAAEGPKEMVSHMRQGDCQTKDFRSDAGSVHGTMECTFEGGASGKTTFDGSFTSDSSSMTMESDQQMPGMAGKSMHMKMQVDTHRVGECSG
jgi:hypothetical protein